MTVGARRAPARAAVACTCFVLLSTGAFVFVHRYAVDWIFADDTLSVDWLRRLRAGELGGWSVPFLWDNEHPLGAQLVVTWLVVTLFGMHFKAVVALSFLLILATVGAVWRLARGARSSLGWETALCLGVALVAFYPTQMEHLLWAFEIGWFLVNGCVVANVLLLERFRSRALVPVATLCLVATFSSAQGAFAWFAAALHLALRDHGRRRWLGSAALAACGTLAAAQVAVHSSALGRGVPLMPQDAAETLLFAIEIVGTTLGARDPTWLLVDGLALLGLAATLGLRLARLGGDPARLRGGVVLIAFSSLCVLGFAHGRFALGLVWLLGSLHAAPLLVPFYLGVALLAAETLGDAAQGDRIAAPSALTLAVLLATGWILSAGYGVKRARLSAMDRGYAAWAACEKHVPFETALRAAGAEPYGDAFAKALPDLSVMCATDLGGLASRLTYEPALFRRLALAHPEAREALSVVWQDYATELPLQVALDPARPDTPARLLALAKREASRDQPFDHVRWAPFAEILRDLP